MIGPTQAELEALARDEGYREGYQEGWASRNADATPWTCIYCERTWRKEESVKTLQDHVLECEKHPTARLLRAMDTLIDLMPRLAIVGTPMPEEWLNATSLVDEIRAGRNG